MSVTRPNPAIVLHVVDRLPGLLLVVLAQFSAMPAGFNRLGPYDRMRLIIHEEWNDEEIEFTKWNIPVWKQLDKHGNTLVRGLRPRLNEPFVVIILGNHLDKIDCYEVTKEDCEYMDY